MQFFSIVTLLGLSASALAAPSVNKGVAHQQRDLVSNLDTLLTDITGLKTAVVADVAAIGTYLPPFPKNMQLLTDHSGSAVNVTGKVVASIVPVLVKDLGEIIGEIVGAIGDVVEATLPAVLTTTTDVTTIVGEILSELEVFVNAIAVTLESILIRLAFRTFPFTTLCVVRSVLITTQKSSSSLLPRLPPYTS